MKLTPTWISWDGVVSGGDTQTSTGASGADTPRHGTSSCFAGSNGMGYGAVVAAPANVARIPGIGAGSTVTPVTEYRHPPWAFPHRDQSESRFIAGRGPDLTNPVSTPQAPPRSAGRQ